MTGILPTKVTLDLTRDGDKATMVYTEGFRGVHRPGDEHPATDEQVRDLVARSVEMFSSKLPSSMLMAIVDDGMAIEVRGGDKYQVLASMMASEFFCWTPFAEMKIRDILLTAVAGQ